MICSDGYSLTYLPNQNMIKIILPQTPTTLTNTVSMVSNRKAVLTVEEEVTILSIVRAIMENGKEQNDEE